MSVYDTIYEIDTFITENFQLILQDVGLPEPLFEKELPISIIEFTELYDDWKAKVRTYYESMGRPREAWPEGPMGLIGPITTGLLYTVIGGAVIICGIIGYWATKKEERLMMQEETKQQAIATGITGIAIAAFKYSQKASLINIKTLGGKPPGLDFAVYGLAIYGSYKAAENLYKRFDGKKN